MPNKNIHFEPKQPPIFSLIIFTQYNSSTSNPQESTRSACSTQYKKNINTIRDATLNKTSTKAKKFTENKVAMLLLFLNGV